jgi:two-component system nitrogen regulation response regulator NtrX
VRVISASSRNLEAEIKNGNLREDLFYRLSVVPLSLPPLAEHKADIQHLVRHFLKQSNSGQGSKLRFSQSAMALMQIYDWPGNTTQLRNVIESIMIMIDKDEVDDDDLPPEITGRVADKSSDGFDNVVGLPLKAAREQFETQYLLSQLSRYNGSISKTADFIGMERSALHRKLKSLNINPDTSNNSEDEG